MFILWIVLISIITIVAILITVLDPIQGADYAVVAILGVIVIIASLTVKVVVIKSIENEQIAITPEKTDTLIIGTIIKKTITTTHIEKNYWHNDKEWME